MMSPTSRALFDLRADQCRWPSRHHLDDPEFHWCGEPAMSDSAYCPKHPRAALDHAGIFQPRGVREAIRRLGIAVPLRRSSDSVDAALALAVTQGDRLAPAAPAAAPAAMPD